MLDICDGGGADCGEQAGLGTWSTLHIGEEVRIAETHENQGCVEIPVVLPHVFSIALHCFLLVRSTETELGAIGWRYICRVP